MASSLSGITSGMASSYKSSDVLALSAYEKCLLCPRRCGAQRTKGKPGVCGMAATPRLARVALHYWEEPPISGEAGSGTMFFSGCSMRCVFCQNHVISSGGDGQDITTARLAQAMLELQEQGALNINLVTALHFAPHIKLAVSKARAAGLTIPIVCNTSGYELPELIAELASTVDVWLTDFKYASSELAQRLSFAPDYPEVAARALEQMLAQTEAAGGRSYDENGAMTRGIIVRHLVMPTHVEDSCAVLDRVWEIAGNRVDISVMNQYTPNERCRERTDELAQSVSSEEYEMVLCHADDLGFTQLWWQEGGTVSESFVPTFDYTGVCGPELLNKTSAV